jgi:hypothetical protein
MQYYSRTQPPTRGAAATVPGTAFTPDGKLHLAVPVRRAAPSSSAGNTAGNRNADGSSSNDLVLMLPQERHGDQARWLLVLLAADAIVLIISLSELGWRPAHINAVLLPGVFGLLNAMLGAYAAVKRLPGALGLFALLALVQLLVGTLLLTLLSQLLHLALLPFMVHSGIMLRRTAMPLWFGTGARGGR